jgi:hypothetical protein
MKKIIIIFLLLNTLLSFSQQYKFNILTNYKSENAFYKESIVYSNKENDSYFLKLYKNNDNNQTIAFLIDLKDSKKHTFKVIESKNDSNDIFFQFVYLKSNDYYTHESLKGHHYEYEVVKKDSLSKTVRMSLMNEKKKVIKTSELEFKNYAFNLFPVFRYSCLHPFEFSKNINFNGTGIVQSYKGFDKKKTIYIYLDYFKEVNLVLNVTP